MINERYLDAFAQLPRDELLLLLRSTQTPESALRHVSGTDFYHYCRASHISHADVIMSLARDTSPLAVRCVERLIMRPIDRRTPAEVNISRLPKPPSIVAAPVRTRQGVTDDRVITVLAETNPKRPGTPSHTRFALYRTGETVHELCQRGGRRADVQWDSDRGYISLSEPVG